MKDKDKTKEQLIDELVKLRQRATRQEASEAERGRMEEALRESEERYRGLIQNIPVGLYRNTPGSKGRFMMANPALLRMFGYETVEEFFQISVADTYGDPAERKAFSEKLLAQGHVAEEKLQLKKRDGTPIWAAATVTVIRDESGEIKYLDGMLEDITERKQAEDELKKYRDHLEVIVKERTAQLEETNKSLGQEIDERNLVEEALRLDESRLETLLKFSQMAEASLDEITDFALEKAIRLTRSKIGYLAFTNEDATVLTMHSWSKSAMAECAIRDKPIVYPLEKTGFWGEAVRQRKPIITNDYAAPDPLKKGYPKGHVHLNRHMSIPVFDGDRIVAVAGVGNKDGEYDKSDVRQLTLLMQGMWRFMERKRADEELRKHRDHLGELVRQRTADLVESEEKYRTLVENVPLVVYRMGSRGETLFVNYFVEKTFGYSPAEIFRNPELWYERVYDEDRVKVEKLREKSFREGKAFIAEYRVKHKNGSIVYVMDHAIPFEATDGLISSVDGIIMDVTGRVKLQEKLVRTEGLKTISEVSARLAHEIRNPLVSAGGFARRLLLSMSREDPNRAKVEIIVKEVGRLEIILRMMLNYIHPFELEKSLTAPNQLLERALSAVESEIKERNVHLDLQLAPGLPEISVDRSQIELAAETLVKQALNQMQEGATLFVSTFQENEMFNLVMRYPVQHMAPDDVEHFFYPFTTSQMGYDTADLPMSKIVVDKHGGVIDVSLEESGELIIHISLPHAQTQF